MIEHPRNTRPSKIPHKKEIGTSTGDKIKIPSFVHIICLFNKKNLASEDIFVWLACDIHFIQKENIFVSSFCEIFILAWPFYSTHLPLALLVS